MNKRAIVLLSGGLDSATCVAITRAQGYDVIALSFDYGQKNIAETNAAKRICEAFDVIEHRTVALPIGTFGGSALTDRQIEVPDFKGDNKIPTTYVPARNTIFLSIALGLAEVSGVDKIVGGMNAVDYSGYVDCRPEYLAAFQAMANLATKQAVEGHPIIIETPLLHLSKAQIIKRGIELGVDYSQTVSCYRATPEGLACGTCDSCHLRKQGFAAANVPDPTLYVNNCA